jgi:hypothetical protein
MRRAAAALLGFLVLSGCTREEARARLQDDIHAIPSTSSTRDFHATRPTSTFSATGFESF